MQRTDFTLEHFRHRLAHLDALPQFAVLGILSGVITGGIIILFRLAIEIPLRFWLSENDPENFEALHPLLHFITPVIGVSLIALFYRCLSDETRSVGIGKVLERFNFHEGHLTLKGAAAQFIFGVISLVSGQSAGREGPAVHLGAACNSYLGQRFHLPNNSIRILVGCGTAAAISASFNTPIAGVIFAMEVVMMEYTIIGFTPIILASVSAAIVSRMVYGHDPAFIVPALSIETLWDIPFTLITGILIGTLAAVFISLAKYCTRMNTYSFTTRAMSVGVLTGLIAVLVPQIMGVGYDSVNLALTGNMGIGMLCALVLAKLIATAIPIGLGMPFGLIGPILVVGASAGAALGTIGNIYLPDYVSEVGIYAMLGMGAMMGAVLQAPLAALMALLELTLNPHIILPGMLAIVIANITSRSIFKQQSIFQTLLATKGIHLRDTPVLQALRRMGVVSLMNQKFKTHDYLIKQDQVPQLLENSPKWIVITRERKPEALLPTSDLVRYMEEKVLAEKEETKPKKKPKSKPDKESEKETGIDLLSIPARRLDVHPIHRQATVQEALDTLQRTGIEALYVERVQAPMIHSVLGVITRKDIENYYLHN